ncbi:MAG: efflux RND transporter permease subunit [Phycisphaerales bacterium]
MSEAAWLARHRRFVVVCLLIVTLAGIAAGLGLPVALFPQVSFPRIAISADAGDRDVDRMVTQVTMPLEEAARAVPGVRSVRSRSSRGSAELHVGFEWGHDMETALLQVQSAIAEASPRLPSGTVVSARRMDPTVFPILGYSLVSPRHALTELGDIASFQVRPALLRVSGVGKVDVQGAPTEEFRVTIDPELLFARGLSFADVNAAIAGANVREGLGRIEDHGKLVLVLASNATSDERSIGALVVGGGPSGVVRVSDVALVERSPAVQWTRVTADGRDAVLVQIYQQPDANSVQIGADVERAIDELRRTLPDGVKLVAWYDQSHLVMSSARGLRDAVLLGTLLAALVLLAFLRNLRVTLLAAIVVPSVLATSCLLLKVLGQSLNIMTLGGMAAAVGLVIDDVIVMVEHIEHRLRADRASLTGLRHPALVVAEEFTRPLIGASAATIIIHIPPAFLSGVIGEFFKALSLTMAISLVVSFMVAWLVVPVLAERIRVGVRAPRSGGASEYDALSRAYAWAMERLLRARWLALPLIALLVALGAWCYPRLRSGFMPPIDEGGFVLDYRTPPGTSLERTDQTLRAMESVLRATPEVATYSRRTGLQLGGGLTEANEGDFFIRLTPLPRRAVEDVMDDVRARVEQNVPGVEIEMAQLMEDVIGDLIGVPQPIEVKLTSEDPRELREISRRVAEALRRIPGIVDVNDGLQIAGDALEVHVDAERAAVDGVDPAAAAAAVAQVLEGRIVTEVERSDLPAMLGVRTWTPRRSRARTEDLERALIPAKDGHLVPLARVAELVPRPGQPQIERENLRRLVAVTARTSGVDLGSAIELVRAALVPDVLTPSGGRQPLRYELGGLFEQQRIAFRGLLGVFAAAIVLVFLLLVYWFESIRIALATTLTSMLAIPGVAYALWLTGTELDISSMMGLTMIVGSVTEVGIFLVAAYRRVDVDAEPPVEDRTGALRRAALSRFRPILMTSIAAILAMLPLALGVGEGAALLTPLAITIIAGLVVQIPLVLVVLPQLLAILRVRPVG